jgi:hypothetical protein
MATWKKVVVESASGTIDQNTTGTAAAWTDARTLSLSGAVTGSASIDGSGNVTLATTAASDPTLTLSGDATGSATFTNLGNATLSVTIADDSHNHVISNVDGLQSALDGKQDADADLTAIAALSSANGNFIVGSASGWVAESGATARASLGLGSLATASTITSSNITDGSINEADLNISNGAQSGYILSSDGSTGFTWIANTAAANDATITLTGGSGIGAIGTFTTNQGTADELTIAVDSTVVRTSGAQNIGGDKTFSDDVVISGNLTVNGDTTTLNTGELHVEDKLIKLANVVSPTTTTGDGAGIEIETSAVQAERPEFKWSNSANLTGWQLSDHNTTSSTLFEVSVMQFGTAAPSSPAIETEAGAGSFFADTNNGNLYLYI